MFRSITTLFIILGMLVFTGCGKDDPEKIAANDREKLLKYIAENDLDAIEHSSGLFYVVENPGSGATPNLYSIVRMNYEGQLLNGTIFDKNFNADFQLSGTIRGWQIGVPQFKSGGKGMLLIPSALGYGDYAYGSIPRSSCLIFDIEIVDVQ